MNEPPRQLYGHMDVRLAIVFQCFGCTDPILRRPQARRHRRRDSLLPRHRSTGPELRLYPLHLFRLLSMLSCLWKTLFLLPRWMACLLTVGEFPFQGDRSAEPRSSVACDSVLDFSGAAMLVASRGMGNLRS